MEQAVTHKVALRIIPLLVVCYLVSFIDKTNIGIAQLGMQGALGLSDAAFGFGAGIFFVGYFLFEVPSNMALARFGARLWIARIMITWGIIVIATALVQGVVSFNIARFLLGAAEAGFYPGALYYLSTWVPEKQRAKYIGLFLLANPVSTVVGAPAMGALLEMHGILGVEGWQWVFIITGLPAMLLAALVIWKLPERPESADWLDAAEKRWLLDTLAEERAKAPVRHANPWKALLDPKVLFLALWFAAFPTAAYGLRLWLPTLIESFGVGAFVNGLLNAIPFAFGALALIIVPRLAVRSGHSYRWIAISTATAAVGLALTVMTGNLALELVCLCIAAIGMFGGQPVFWSLPSKLLVGANAAAGLALVNSVGNLGGFVGPYAVGAIRQATGSLSASMLFLALVMAAAAVLAGVGSRVLQQRSTESPDPTESVKA